MNFRIHGDKDLPQRSGVFVTRESEDARQNILRLTGFRVHNLKYQITRLEGLLELREREFKEQYKKRPQDHHKNQVSQISCPNKIPPFQMEQVDVTPHLSLQETNWMASRSEAEEEKLSDNCWNIWSLCSDSQNSDMPQTECLKEVNRVKQELHDRDNEILYLSVEKDDLSQRLMDTTNQLRTRGADPGRQNTTFWRRSSGRSCPRKKTAGRQEQSENLLGNKPDSDSEIGGGREETGGG